jgi:AcrR family transcriptional regulator
VTRVVNARQGDAAGQAQAFRLVEGVRPDSAQRLMVAGVELFSSTGFHGTTTRDIAQRAGMSPAALYIHYRSKGELLGAIMLVAHQSVLDALAAAVSSAGEDPVDRLRRLATAFVRWQGENIQVARIGVQHLGVIPDEQFGELRRMRRAIEEHFESVLRDGMERGAFAVGDLRLSMLSLIALGMDLTRWYGPGRSHSPAEIGEYYGELAIRMVKA